MNKDDQSINACLQRISDTLLINGGFLPNLGLYTGDMGIVLFFYRYASLTHNEIYLEYASGLLEKIQSKLHRFSPLNYKQGLTGIGSGIEYLAQNDYFKTDLEDLLKEFDKRIFFTYNLSCLNVDQIADIGYYATWRLSGNSAQKEMILKSVMPQIVNDREEMQVNGHQMCIIQNSTRRQQQEFDLSASLTKYELGIQNGLAGIGLSFISELDGDDSWLSLFPNDLILS